MLVSRVAFRSIKSSQSCWVTSENMQMSSANLTDFPYNKENLVLVFLFLWIVYEYIAGIKNKKDFGAILSPKYGPEYGPQRYGSRAIFRGCWQLLMPRMSASVFLLLALSSVICFLCAHVSMVLVC